MSKYGLIKEKQADHARNEKEILETLDHPFIVKMRSFDQDSQCIYITQEFIRGGEFLTLLRQKQVLSIDTSRFFISQITLMLEYLHENNVMYRDLKPENILVDKSGYLKVIDFGLSKKVYSKTYTVCGTPHYIAPEVLWGEGYDKSADWYSMGVMLYEMLCGQTPHNGENTMELFRSIVKDTIKYPANLDKKAKRLLKSLLNKDPSKRICNNQRDIKTCSFFKSIDFDAILNRELEPPFFPSVRSDDDTSNFKKFKVSMLSTDNCPRLAPEDDIFLDW
jgi:serine/threonine protein kinase